jgi:hypothetical protein
MLTLEVRHKGCGFEFCYVCRAPYTGPQGIRRIGNSAHAEGCRYHSSKLPRHPETDFHPDDEVDMDSDLDDF